MSNDVCGIDEVMSNVESFGDRLRARRLHNGWTQVEFARRMGIGPMEVSSYERGAHRPRMQRMAMMAQVLGVPAAWLVFGEGEA